jgi:primosomal protein N' (replication factor Y) (superfamily II helicase)
MQIAEIIPLVFIPRPQKQVFSYFLQRELPEGALAEVPVGKRVVSGIVSHVRPLSASKLEIKKGPFTLKSIKKIISAKPVYTAEQIALFLWISETYWASLGKTFALAAPCTQGVESTYAQRATAKPAKSFFIIGERRTQKYSEILKRFSIAGKNQSLIIVPDKTSAKFVASELQQFLPHHKIVLHSSGTKKSALQTLYATLNDAQDEQIVVVGTRSALFLPFKKLACVIIDGAGDNAYGPWLRTPRYDAVKTAEKLCELHEAQVVYGDFMHTTELYNSLQSGEIEQVKISDGKPSRASCGIIDMRYQSHWSGRHPFTIEVKDGLKRAIRGEKLYEPSFEPSSRKQAIVFINRKGVASALVCRNCGHVPRCNACDIALVLHEPKAFSETVRGILRCHHCGKSLPTPSKCPKCESYRIFPVGTGTVQVESDINRTVPEARIARIDSDSVKTDKELDARLKAFREKDTDILVGTQMMLKPGKLPRAEFSAVLGIESNFVFPSYDSKERAWRTLEILRAATTGKIVVQALNADDPFFDYLSRSDSDSFFASEIAERRRFGYPPFGEVIKFSISHKDRWRAENEAKQLAALLEAAAAAINSAQPAEGHGDQTPSKSEPKTEILGPSPAFMPRERNKWKFIVLAKIPVSTAPEVRMKLLSQAGPAWRIEINPRELL